MDSRSYRKQDVDRLFGIRRKTRLDRISATLDAIERIRADNAASPTPALQ
jgi:hypothetical protein